MSPWLLLVPSAREAQGLALQARPEAADQPFLGSFDGRVRFALSGLGAASAICAAHFLTRFRFERVLLVGLAGAVPGQGLALGQLVQANEEHFADLGYERMGRIISLEESGLPLLNWREGELGTPLPCAPLDAGLTSGSFATVNTVTQGAERIAEWVSRGMVAENMEGAGVAMACQIMGVPFSEVRAISNFLGPRDPSLWQTEAALAALREWLREHLP